MDNWSVNITFVYVNEKKDRLPCALSASHYVIIDFEFVEAAIAFI